MLYAGDAVLTDVCVAPSGAVCCLQRRPNEARVLSWEGEPSGQPTVWLPGQPLAVTQIFGFDGKAVFGIVGRDVVELTPDDARLLYRGRGPVSSAASSPDRKRVLWIETVRRRQAAVAGPGESRGPVPLTLGDECYAVAWVDDDTVAAVTVNQESGLEAGTRLTLVALRDNTTTRVLTTFRGISQLAANPCVRSLALTSPFFLGADALESQRRHAAEDPLSASLGQEARGVWLVKLTGDPEATCISNEVPATPPVVLATGDVFMCASVRAHSSVLVRAAAGRSLAAEVPAFLRRFEFLPGGEAIIYATLNNGRGEIQRLSVAALLERKP